MESEIKEFLQEFGVSFKQNSKSFILACPKCSKSDKLYIRKKDGRFCCWVCAETENFKGKPEFVLTELAGIPLSEVRKKIYGIDESRASTPLMKIQFYDFVDEDEEEIVQIPDSLPEIRLSSEIVPIDHPQAVRGREYMEARGIPLSVCLEYDIRYWISKRRVVFLVKQEGAILGYQARTIDKTDIYWNEEISKFVKPLKAITSENLNRDRVVMFSERITGDHVVICEGPVDALKAHLCGGNIATLGKSVSQRQLDLIRNSGVKKVYLALDPDAARDVQRIYEHFQDLEVYDLRPPAPYKDIGEMSMEDVLTLFKEAKPLKPGHIFLYLKKMERAHV